MEPSTLIASLGVFILLVAFLLNLFGILRQQDWNYLFMNFAGAILACYASWMIDFLPFVILEGTWALAAGAGITRKILNHRK